MIDVTMPQLGESVSEGTITKWLVQEGAYVQKDQSLLEIATDKADSELPSPAAGRVVKLLAKEGDVVPVKSVVCQIDETAKADAPAPASGKGGDKPAEKSDKPAEKTEKAEAKSDAKAEAAPPSGGGGGGASRSATGGSLATPTARAAARESGVDLAGVQGSGERGRIVPDDVRRAASGGGGSAPAPAAPPPASASGAERVQEIQQLVSSFVPPVPGKGFGAFKVPPYRPQPGDKVVPFTRRRRITSDHMTYSKQVSPHVVTVAEIDLFQANKLREAHKDRYKKEGSSLTMLAFLVMATARALRETPAINARVLDDSFVLFRDINIGVAVDSPDGLVVPVVRRADELGVRGIVRSIDELAGRAKNGKITIDDLSGATFSVSNPGIKGNLFGGAIINQPNVGILRMGEIKKRVVVVDGADGQDQLAIHPVMYVALSYDHRIVDGVAANSFLWRVRDLLEKADFEV